MNNKEKIKNLTIQMLDESYKHSLKKIDKALNSGAIDLDAWDENVNPMLIPKAILIAILLDEADQHDCKGTSFGRQVNRDAKNIGYFL